MKSEAYDELLSETMFGNEVSLPYLEIRNGPEDGKIFPIKTNTVCIGRNPHVEIGEMSGSTSSAFAIKTDRSISRVYCSIETKEDGSLLLRDLDSRYGTQLNSRNIDSAPCKNGDLILIGDTQLMVHTKEE